MKTISHDSSPNTRQATCGRPNQTCVSVYDVIEMCSYGRGLSLALYSNAVATFYGNSSNKMRSKLIA